MLRSVKKDVSGDDGDDRGYRYGLALLNADLGEHAGGGRGYLRVHLVGADLEQRLAFGNRVADLLEPFVDGALVDGLPHPGHDNLRHQFLQEWPPSAHTLVSASSRRGSGPALASSVARSTASRAFLSIASRVASSTPRAMRT